MYSPIGWPNAINLNIPGETDLINHVCTDAVKILIAAVGSNFLGIWYANPLVPITFYRRNQESVDEYGHNELIVWKPDSKQIAILTSRGVLINYQIEFGTCVNGIFVQIDPPTANLRRDSAELFSKESIPRLNLHEICYVQLNASITTLCCVSLTELLIATRNSELLRMQWSELRSDTKHAKDAKNNEASSFVNLCAIPFHTNRNTNTKNITSITSQSYIIALEYSPFIGGCAAVFNDNRAAYLTAMHLPFELQNMHGFWVAELEDATVCSVNHKFRLLAYGRSNAYVSVYVIEEETGNLELSHHLSLGSTIRSDVLGAVQELKWSPDGCVLAVACENGGISLWSTFGALLMSTMNWDFGLHMDAIQLNPLRVRRMEWSTEGYQVYLTCARDDHQSDPSPVSTLPNVYQLNFVKSALTMNTCMASHSHILLQGDDTIYINQGYNLEKIYNESMFLFPNFKENTVTTDDRHFENMELKKSTNISSALSENKYWSVLPLPLTYAQINWPIRYSAIDEDGLHVAVAGRTGFAHYSIVKKKWKLFGNESHERDFVVSGGILWWNGFIVMGCYSLIDRIDEIRCYPEDCKLSNQFSYKTQLRAPVISLNRLRNQLITLTADGIVSLFTLEKRPSTHHTLNIRCTYEVDVTSICIHPACIVSLTIANLKMNFHEQNDSNLYAAESTETIIVNVSGRILMIQRESVRGTMNALSASCLASCTENFWLSDDPNIGPMSNCLWLFSGIHGMRVWLPILPPTNQLNTFDAPTRLHNFMSKRIMLTFPLKLYPLVLHFENVMVLGVENETMIYTNEVKSHFSLPFCYLERKSQVYLHKILRQLIKRNLGYHAWEIAKFCSKLPYFPHSLELLLHEILEEEATSKGPIPDALLPSVLNFIREFPVSLQTIVQCARKTEIALWPHLFSVAGKPKDLFQQCLQSEELETAASFLIILQNLEPSYVSKRYAILLLDIALQNCKWDLAKNLTRFLKTIDPCEIDSPRSSMIVNLKITPMAQPQSQGTQNPELFNLVLGPIARERRYSGSITSSISKDGKDKYNNNLMVAPASSPPNHKTFANSEADHQVGGIGGGGGGGSGVGGGTNTSITATSVSSAGGAGAQLVQRRKTINLVTIKDQQETFCVDSILQRHAQRLLCKYKLIELGYMSAYLDFHLVSWLSQEADTSAKLQDFVVAFIILHKELQIPTKLFVSKYQIDNEYGQLHQQHQQQSHRGEFERRIVKQTPSQTSESGYFSSAVRDTPTSVNIDTTECCNAIQREPTDDSHSVVQYGTSMFLDYPKHLNAAGAATADINASLDGTRYASALSFHKERSVLALGQEYRMPPYLKLPEKLSIKMRYLLQLFIEANCTDYALLLSILLQDAASIGRIIDFIIRSESLSACNRIESALKHLVQWAFYGECSYRTFLVSLQPYIYLLEQYIKSHSIDSTLNLSDTSESCETSASANEEVLKSYLESSPNYNNWSLDQLPQSGRHKARTRTESLSKLNKSNVYKPAEKGAQSEPVHAEPNICNLM